MVFIAYEDQLTHTSLTGIQIRRARLEPYCIPKIDLQVRKPFETSTSISSVHLGRDGREWPSGHAANGRWSCRKSSLLIFLNFSKFLSTGRHP